MAEHTPIRHQVRIQHGQAETYGIAEQEFGTPQKVGVAAPGPSGEDGTKVADDAIQGKGQLPGVKKNTAAR